MSSIISTTSPSLGSTLSSTISAADLDPILDADNPDLIFFHNMEQVSGPTLFDASPKNYDGTITGATQVAGKLGSALNFNSASDIVSLPASSAAQIQTFSYWVKTTNSGTTNILYETSADTNQIQGSLVLYLASNGSPAINMRSVIAVQVATLTTPIDLTDGFYHHVIIEFDNTDFTSGRVKMDVDGVSRLVSFSDPIEHFGPTSNLSYMGQRVNGAAPFVGDLDLFRAYDRALTSQEKLTLWNGGSGA